MIPLKLTLSGFMSYREEQTLDFKDDSLWVLVGKNASGKTSIFDAIIFVLFGETRIKGIPNGELVNHHSDAAQITFDFAVGNKQYRVKRTIDKKGNATRQASVLLLKPDGSLAPQPIPLTHKEKEFKNWMENDIGLNYEVFITSVLLRQGKADAFLEASTEMRYDVLSKLINLSKYVALEGKAREQKKFWEAQASFFRDNLNRISPVTEQELAKAQTAIERENDAVQAAQRWVDMLQTFFGQASQWEHLDAELQTNEGKVAGYVSLQSRADEIHRCYQRLIALRGVLPSLRAVFDLVTTIGQEETEVKRLSDEWQIDNGHIKTAEQTVGELGADYERKASQAQEIADESTRVNRRLRELSTVVGLIAQIGQLEKTLSSQGTALAEYPDNLDELLKTSEMERDRLLESRQAVPGLSRLVTERTRLAAAEQRRLSLDHQLHDLEDRRPGVSKSKDEAQADFEKAETYEKRMRDALTEANTLLASARKQMEKFNQVAGAAKCQYCGSDLTEAHKTQERDRLENDIQEKDRMAEKAKEEHECAAEALAQAKTLRRSTAEALTRLDSEIGATARELKVCEGDIRERLAAIGMTFDSLPSVYQGRVCVSKPGSVNAWVETIYPQNSDLEELEDAVRRIPMRQAETARLAEQVSKRNQTRTLWAGTRDTLTAKKAALPSDWEALQSEHTRLSANEDLITTSLETAQQEQREANSAWESARRELQEIRDRQTRRAGIIETTRTTLQRNQSNLAARIAQLPEDWQEEAGAMTEEKLGQLTAEMSELQEYEELHQQLAAAGKTLSELRTRQAEVQRMIEALPAEARRPAEQVGAELFDARGASRQAEIRLDQAQTHHAQMLIQRDQYNETEANMKGAERKAHLYGILSEQFGEKGIQKAIINKAEISIVRLSNEMLDNLSGGRSKLRLRGSGGNKKALDLEVWDSQTGGDKPIIAGLASGSQRFRIAISLALGIGRYIGNESNRIESVIIDEGFGSLDREGRESIIQELYNLSRHLKRIILVSHQEEFSKGFQTGYEIFLDNGASQIRPLVQ